MAVEFKYALVEINKKPVLVDKKKIDDAPDALKTALAKIDGLTTEALQHGFALETPEGMSPLVLGTANDFSVWVTAKMNSTFNLKASIGTLPDPFKSGLNAMIDTELVIYSAVLFYTGETGKPETAKKLYGELVIGFKIPETLMKDFPLALREIVIAINNYPPPKSA
jgi:hypothetical protein